MSDRASIFEKPKTAIDLSGFAPRSDQETRPKPEDLEQLTRGSKFRSREGVETEPEPVRVQQRRRRTGRNVQFNIRATQQVIDEYKAISEEMDWPDGLTLEKALRALKRELAGQKT
jgi:hypothetical protein